MKKFGFTLAEVLITLGIIGVVAALTAPGLVLSSRNEANAAKLSVNVSNLENAFTTMIAKEGVESLFQTAAWQSANPNGFAGNLGLYLHINGLVSKGDAKDSTSVTEYYKKVGYPTRMTENGGKDEKNQAEITTTGGDERFGPMVIETKNGAALIISPNKSYNTTEEQKKSIINGGGSLFNEAADLYIDINGKQAPNTVGRDLFCFYLGDDGILYPMGGKDVSLFDKTFSKTGTPGPLWETACADGKITSSYACTARLISEGYKMNY